MFLGLTSSIYDKGQLYDGASTIMEQKLSQIPGVGQVRWEAALFRPVCASRLNPTQLNSYGLGLQDVASMLSTQNSNLAKRSDRRSADN